MTPFNSSEYGTSGFPDNRLVRLSYGAASPLWLPFIAAASAGAMVWMMSRWMRGEFAATLPAVAPMPTGPAPSAADLMSVGAIDASLPTTEATVPAAEPDLATQTIDRGEDVMLHNAPSAQASAAVDTAPPPPVPAEAIMEHTPAQTMEAEGNPETERAIDLAQPAADPALLGDEPVGNTAPLAETSAAVLGGAATFGGDVRAEETAEASLAPVDVVSGLVDAAYAENLGPIPTPAPPSRSRKRKTVPGTAPGA